MNVEFMKLILVLLFSIGVAPLSLASYYESWILEGEVIRICGKKETEKILAQNGEIEVPGQNQIGIEIKLTKCTPTAGGSGKCKVGQRKIIVLGYDASKIAKPSGGKMSLQIRYDYSEGLCPDGEVGRSHQWRLVSVLPGEVGGDQKPGE